MSVENKQQFGQWSVEYALKSQRVYMVSHPEKKGQYVLKKAYEANSSKLSHREALKDHHRFVLDMQTEIKALQRVSDHPNIITMVDFSMEDAWHVTEKIEGVDISGINFYDWPLERLTALHSNIRNLAKPFGYLHSKGILLNGDIELFITPANDFVILDFEQCTVWDNHHLDTTHDLEIVSGLIYHTRDRIKKAKRQAERANNNRKMVERTLEHAQPSAPRRLNDPEKNPNIARK